MWETLRSLVGMPTAVALLFVGAVILILSAVTGSVASTFLGGLLALVFFVAAFAVLFAVYIRRMNEDIDSDRHELRQELDEMVEEADTEE
jgi:ABC-type transport system involved in cytochrome bd biosynthesis fused ATPase/permease subunit